EEDRLFREQLLKKDQEIAQQKARFEAEKSQLKAELDAMIRAQEQQRKEKEQIELKIRLFYIEKEVIEKKQLALQKENQKLREKLGVLEKLLQAEDLDDPFFESKHQFLGVAEVSLKSLAHNKPFEVVAKVQDSKG